MDRRQDRKAGMAEIVGLTLCLLGVAIAVVVQTHSLCCRI